MRTSHKSPAIQTTAIMKIEIKIAIFIANRNLILLFLSCVNHFSSSFGKQSRNFAFVMNFSAVIFVILLQIHSSLQFARVMRMSCNSTGLTAIKPICQLKALSRINMTISVGAEVIKLIPQYFVSSKFDLRYTQIAKSFSSKVFILSRVQNHLKLASNLQHT
jgi:hypothetical protein